MVEEMMAHQLRHNLIKLHRSVPARRKARRHIHLHIGVFQPATQPVFLMRVEMCKLAEMHSLQLVSPGHADFEYLNLVWHEGEPGSSRTAVELLVRFDPTMEDRDVINLNLADGQGHHYPIARISRKSGLVHIESLDDQRCSVVDLLHGGPDELCQIFVGGAPKSGTTWVESMLNAHPDCVLSGENAFWEWPLSDRLFTAQTTPEEYEMRRLTVSEPPRTNAVAMMGYGRAALTLQQLAVLSGRRFVGDKTPGNSAFAMVILIVFPHAHFVHCVRNPLDILVSRAFHEILVLGNALDKQTTAEVASVLPERFCRQLMDKEMPAPGAPRDALVREIVRDADFCAVVLNDQIAVNAAVAAAKAAFPNRVHMLHYEDMAADPRAALGPLLAAIGLSAERAVVDDLIDAASFSKLAGGRRPGQADVDSFFRKGVVGDYKNYLTDEAERAALARVRDSGCSLLARYLR